MSNIFDVLAGDAREVTGIPQNIVDNVKWVESRNNPNAVSPKGATGTMQTMPSTLRDPGYGVTPARDNSPEEKERVGKDYLAALYRKFGDIRKALAAYNWGPGNVEAAIASDPEGWEKKLPKETRAYIPKVLGESTKQTSSGNIFDEIAAGGSSQGGNIFDQLSQEKPSNVQIVSVKSNPTIIDKTIDYAKETGKWLRGEGETAAQMVSGALAMPVAGLAGLVTSVGGLYPERGANTVEKVSDFLTYKPTTPEGQMVSEVANKPFEWMDKGAGWVGEKVADVTGSPELGAATKGGLMVAVPGLAGKLLKKTMPTKAAAADIIKEAVETKTPIEEVIKKREATTTGESPPLAPSRSSVTSESVTPGVAERGSIELPEGLGETVKSRLKETAKSFQEFWRPTTTLPEGGKWYLKERYKVLGDLDRVEGLTGKVYDKLKPLSEESKVKIFQAVDGTLPLTELETSDAFIAKQMINMNDRIGMMAVKEGLLTQETFDAHKGQYVKYLYLKHILGDDARIPAAGGKMDLGWLKERKDLTRDQQRAIGLIEDISIAQPVGMASTLSDIAKNKFYGTIASDSRAVWEPSIVKIGEEKWGIGKLAEEVKKQEEIAKAAPNVPEIQERLKTLKGALDEAQAQMKGMPDDFVQMPVNAKYGDLSGTFIRKPIARDILPVWEGVQSKGNLSSMINTFVRMEEKAMAGFKVGKTALNIPTGARNIVSNMIQLNMSGMGIWEIPEYGIKAANAMITKTPEFIQAKRQGLFKTNWGQAEIGEVLGVFQEMQKSPLGVWKYVDKLAKYYGKIDDFFKMAKYLDEVEGGADAATAAVEAQKWGMDYSLAHPSIKVARRYVAPFVSYQYKILPLIAKSMAKRPWVIAKYVAAPYLMIEASKKMLNLTDEDWQKLRRTLPMYIKKSGTYALMPWKSPEGNAQWVNLEYFFPWQNVMALGRDVRQGNYGELVGDLGIGNPIVDVYTVAKTMRGDSPPKDPFTGADIYNKLDTPTEKATAVSEWLYNKWGPSMLSRQGAVGYTAKAASGEKDKYGRTVTPAQAAGRWVGVNIVAPTPQQTQREARAKMMELKSSLAKVLKDPTVSKSKKQSAMTEFRSQMQELKGLSEE